MTLFYYLFYIPLNAQNIVIIQMPMCYQTNLVCIFIEKVPQAKMSFRIGSSLPNCQFVIFFYITHTQTEIRAPQTNIYI